MSRSEHAEQNDALVALSALPESLFYRNNTGTAWQGQRLNLAPGAMVKVEPGMVILRQARPISFGLPGSADIAGTISGIAAMVEMKTLTGPQRITQINFEKAWRKAGGFYVLARSADEAVAAIATARNKRIT